VTEFSKLLDRIIKNMKYLDEMHAIRDLQDLLSRWLLSEMPALSADQENAALEALSLLTEKSPRILASGESPNLVIAQAILAARADRLEEYQSWRNSLDQKKGRDLKSVFRAARQRYSFPFAEVFSDDREASEKARKLIYSDPWPTE